MSKDHHPEFMKSRISIGQKRATSGPLKWQWPSLLIFQRRKALIYRKKRCQAD